SLRNADDGGLVIVEFECAPELERFAWKQQLVTGPVDDHRIRLAQAFPRAEYHGTGRAGQRSVVESKAERDSQLSVEGARDRTPLVEFDGPLHAVHAAHAREIGILERLGLLEVFGLPVHYPDVRVGDIGDLTAGPLEDAGEDGRLVLQQKRAKR